MNRNNIVRASSLTEWYQIDQGHFGSVFKAKYIDFQVLVAVKKLKGNVSQGLDELVLEAEKMASASINPYVIRLYGILEGNIRGIVMEYMENGSLCTLMERVSEIPWALKYRILHEVTLGMNWLHNLPTPLLHLDLKTKNVLLTEELHIKITDFGLSKYTKGSSIQGQQDCDGVGGTLEYMPPEAFQEGYVPSKSTDVYSFAILSAVVLRGENPYPVDKSALVRELVPHGQRPCLQSLEKKTSVKYLKEATDFTKCCWDNDKSKRPPFSECCNKWDSFSKAFNRNDIRKAVSLVQECLESSVPFGKATDVSHRQESTSVNTRDMSEMVQKLSTMNYSESPPVPLESSPIVSAPNMQYATVQPSTVQQGHPQGASGSNSRPQYTYYQESTPIMRAQNSQYASTVQQGHPQGASVLLSRPQYIYYQDYRNGMNSPNTAIQNSRIHPKTSPQGPATGSKYLYPYNQGLSPYWGSGWPPGYQNPRVSGFPPASQTSPHTINISNSSNFQIGNNSVINVTDNSYPGPFPSMMPMQFGNTTRSYSPSQMSPQQKQTAQGDHNMPARETSSGQPCKQETVDKSDEKSYISPTQTTTEGHPGNANPQQETQCNMPTTGNPTTKPPGQ